MGKVDIKKEKIIQAITAHLISNGLNDVGLRTLAAVSDTSDRMLIYYFGTKDGLLGVVLESIANGFADQLDMLLGTEKRDPDTLRAELLALAEVPDFLTVIRLWFEIVGQAGRGNEPYTTAAAAIAQDWLTWVESHLIDPQPGEAFQLFAELEGRLMLKVLGISQ